MGIIFSFFFPRRKKIFFLEGVSGTGKTTALKELSKSQKYRVLLLDIIQFSRIFNLKIDPKTFKFDRICYASLYYSVLFQKLELNTISTENPIYFCDRSPISISLYSFLFETLLDHLKNKNKNNSYLNIEKESIVECPGYMTFLKNIYFICYYLDEYLYQKKFTVTKIVFFICSESSENFFLNRVLLRNWIDAAILENDAFLKRYYIKIQCVFFSLVHNYLSKQNFKLLKFDIYNLPASFSEVKNVLEKGDSK